MKIDPVQLKLLNAVASKNPVQVDDALAQGGQWHLNQYGLPMTWEPGGDMGASWDYSAAAMALSDMFNDGRSTIAEKITMDETHWTTALGAILVGSGNNSPSKVINMVRNTLVLDILYKHWPSDILGRWDTDRTQEGLTPLHILAQRNRMGAGDLIQYLVEKGLDVNAMDNRGRTPLHFAVHIHTVRTLLDLHADPMAPDHKNRTPARALMTTLLRNALDKKQGKQKSWYKTEGLDLLLRYAPVLQHPQPGSLARSLRTLIDRRREGWPSEENSLAVLENHLAAYNSLKKKKALEKTARAQKTKKRSGASIRF